MRATCPARLILLDWLMNTRMGRELTILGERDSEAEKTRTATKQKSLEQKCVF
jgi:hypothetical protein